MFTRSRFITSLAAAVFVGAATVCPSTALAQGHAEPAPAVGAGHAADSHSAADPHGAGAHAAGAHDKAGVLPTAAQGIAPMVVSLVVFGLVFAVLATTAWPKIVKGLKDREDKIRNEIEAAEMAQQQAKAALQQYERNLAEAQAKAQRMLEETKAQQQALAADLRAKAEIELNEMRERAKRDIESAKRAALNEIWEETGNVATEMAAKILRKQITAADQQRLVRESLAELQAAGARG